MNKLTPEQINEFADGFKKMLERAFKPNEHNQKHCFRLALFSFCETAGFNDKERFDFMQKVGGNW